LVNGLGRIIKFFVGYVFLLFCLIVLQSLGVIIQTDTSWMNKLTNLIPYSLLLYIPSLLLCQFMIHMYSYSSFLQECFDSIGDNCLTTTIFLIIASFGSGFILNMFAAFFIPSQTVTIYILDHFVTGFNTLLVGTSILIASFIATSSQKKRR
jgi:hypothetical protein